MTLHLKFWDKNFSLCLELFDSDSLTIRLPGIRLSPHPSPTSQCQNYRQMPPCLAFRQALKIQTQIFLLALSSFPAHKLNVKATYSRCTIYNQIQGKLASVETQGTFRSDLKTRPINFQANGLTVVVEKTHTDGVIITQGMSGDIWDHFLGIVLGKKLLSTCGSLDLFRCLLKPDPSTHQCARFWWNAVGGWFSWLLIQFFKCESSRGRLWSERQNWGGFQPPGNCMQLWI